jgi:hypothetical protein
LRELQIDPMQWETGRPRTDAYIVYLFLMLRGFNGGCKDQHARLLPEESITLRLWLEHLGLQLPPASTLSDNFNAVSNQTHALIHQIHLRYIVQQGQDDFQKGLEEALGLGVKVVSISGAKNKRAPRGPAMEKPALPRGAGRAQRDRVTGLHFKRGFEFGEMARRTHENVLAEMLEKVLAYNISQIIRIRGLQYRRPAICSDRQ